MKIELKKFGNILTSRQSGKEALAAFQPTLREVQKNEQVKISFDGVVSLSPSWADEFITQLQREYGDKLILHRTNNPSVETTMELLEEINEVKFIWEN